MSSGQSMERFGPVAADHFTGRVVESVDDSDDGEWVIRLEGGAEIHNFDPTVAKPTAIVNAALTKTILGGHSLSGAAETRLLFGLEQVVLNPLEYAIMEPHYTRGELVFPERSEANMPIAVPDEPQGRAQEGPEDHHEGMIEEDDGG